jgi:8-oxo-dGTP diphosphatase
MGYAGFAFLLHPALWCGDEPGELTKEALTESVWRSRLQIGLEISVTREGLLLIDFGGWQETSKAEAVRDNDVGAMVEMDERRVAVGNAFLACLHTALLVEQKMGHRAQVITPAEVIHVTDIGPLAVDVVLLTVSGGELLFLAVDAATGGRALPGGFVTPSETAAMTAARTLAEKTGLRNIYLEQLATFTDPQRDRRGWIPSVAYLALVPATTTPTDGTATWEKTRRPPKLAYDHKDILRVALNRIRGKLWWSNVAVGTLQRAFTLGEARRVYEAIAGTDYDPSTFARDLRSTGLVARTGDYARQTGGRPAALYSFVARTPTWGAGRNKRVPGTRDAEPATLSEGWQ